MRNLERTFACFAQAGVAHNKILAKLVRTLSPAGCTAQQFARFRTLPDLTRTQGCGLHKPNQQTLVPLDATAALLAPLDLTRLRGALLPHNTSATQPRGAPSTCTIWSCLLLLAATIRW
eukprot:COSAG06_NODE_9349_length_1924_cov_0.986301_1_plen_119_part_00